MMIKLVVCSGLDVITWVKSGYEQSMQGNEQESKALIKYKIESEYERL